LPCSPTCRSTVWHSLYDHQARTVAASFHLGEEMQADGTHRERRSDYMAFRLASS